jgi:hypothetical protein
MTDGMSAGTGATNVGTIAGTTVGTGETIAETIAETTVRTGGGIDPPSRHAWVRRRLQGVLPIPSPGPRG